MDNQRVRILISKDSRADMLLEMSNARQNEPQRVDLNVHTNLPAISHAPCSFTAWAHAASLAGNQPIYHDAMPLSIDKNVTFTFPLIYVVYLNVCFHSHVGCHCL